MASFLVTVAKWGSSRGENVSFQDYLTNVKKISTSTRAFKTSFSSKEDLRKLKQTTFDALDVTFICKLLPLSCDGIADIEKWKKINDSTMLEYHLNQIKQIRNSVMHEPYGAALDKNLLNGVETIALKLLDIAGAKYGKGADEINVAKYEAQKLISTIRNTNMTEEGKVYFYRQMIENEGLSKLREKVYEFRGSISPYFDHVDGFCSLQLTYKEKGHEEIISCEDILLHARVKGVRMLLIEGQSGAGKSYLLKELQADILKEEGKPRTFRGSTEFKTPLLFECRTQNCDTIADLATKEFPCLQGTLREDGLTEKVLSQMKGIVLVDGLDEETGSSKKMLENVLAFLKNNREIFCIFTSRPFSAEKFRKKLKREGFSHFRTLALKELASKNEQMEFLKTSYKEGIYVSSTYEGSDLNLKTPVLLAIYNYLWLNNPESLKKCRSKASIMRAWIECGLEVAKQRLDQRNIMNCEDVAENILKSISLLSFSCLVKGQLDVKKQEIRWLKDQITKEFTGISANISPHEILSCFLVSSSDKTKDEILLYGHKVQQEILSSIYVANQIESGKYYTQILSDAIKSDSLNQSSLPRGTNDDVKRSFLK